MNQPDNNKPFLIGICGGSGSGKTSFIRQLKTAFAPDDLCVVSQDDYYLPRSEQKTDAQGIENFDLPGSIDKKSLRKDLQRLMAGETVSRAEYTFNNDAAATRSITFHPAPIIVIEGLFVFHYKKINALLDLRVFINAKDNLKVIRRIARDRMERNYPIEDVLYRYQHHVLPAYERYIQPYRDESDLVINNNQHFDKGLMVLQGFIAERIRSARADQSPSQS